MKSSVNFITSVFPCAKIRFFTCLFKNFPNYFTVYPQKHPDAFSGRRDAFAVRGGNGVSTPKMAAALHRAGRSLRGRRPAILSYTPQASIHIYWRKSFLALSFEERAKEDREAKMIGNPPHTSLNDHKRLRCFARSFRALGVHRLLRPTFSHRGNRQAKGLPRDSN